MSKSRNYQNEATIGKTLIELLIYLTFLIITTIVCFSTSDHFMFYFNEMIQRLFLKRTHLTKHGIELIFYDMVTIEDWWHFMKTTFLDGLHGIPAHEEPHTSKPTPKPESSSSESIENVSPESTSNNSSDQFEYDNYYIENSLLLGPPRIRQLRSAKGTCQIHKIFKEYFRDCFAKYNWLNEETYSDLMRSHYVESVKINSIWTWGKLTYYPGGGFIEYLNYTRAENEQTLNELMDIKWIDRGTRFLAVEFSLYNVNVNLFCIVKFFAEISPTGGIIPWARIQSFKFITLWTFADIFFLVCLVIFYIFVTYYLMEEIWVCRSNKLKYFLSVWNILDFTIIVISFITLVYNITRKFYLKSIFNYYKANPHEYLNLDQIAQWEFIYNNLMAILVFLVWIKIFKYIGFSKTIIQFTNTLQRCSKDLIGFGIMFLIVFVAFAQLGYLLFGSENASFQTFRISVLTMIRMILGDFDYPAIESANRILGPIYFLTYIFIVFFILLNMFIAIINDTYSDVKNDDTQTGDSVVLVQFLKKQCKIFFAFLCCKKKIKDDDKNDIEVEQQSNNKKPAPKRNVGTNEIIPKLFEIISVDKSKPSSGDIEKLNNRVSKVEATLDKLLHGIDALVNKLEKERLSKKKKK